MGIFFFFQSIVPLLSQSSLKYRKAIPKGPFHSKHKQQVHREHFIEQALHQVGRRCYVVDTKIRSNIALVKWSVTLIIRSEMDRMTILILKEF